jgi:hypothetical protein
MNNFEQSPREGKENENQAEELEVRPQAEPVQEEGEFDNGENLEELRRSLENEKKLAIEKTREEINREMQYSGARTKFGKIFDGHGNGQERTEELLSILKLFLKSDLIDGPTIENSIKELSGINSREEFVEKAISSLKPLLDLRAENSEAIEKIEREAFVENVGATKINEVLSYSLENGDVHLHLSPARHLKSLRSQVAEGLKSLAEIVKNNEKIKKIVGTSWIVAEHPKIMEGLGFKIDGVISEQLKNERFIGDDREIAEASMSREEFLEKYGK